MKETPLGGGRRGGEEEAVKYNEEKQKGRDEEMEGGERTKGE